MSHSRKACLAKGFVEDDGGAAGAAGGALGVLCIVAKLYGLDSIFTFAFPLMMGMISGVYTSLCVSTSAWVLWSERKPKTKA